MKGSLLEYLREQIGCPYLSDLPVSQYRSRIVTIMEGLKPDSFDLQEWAEAVSYLTKEYVSFSDAAEALDYLKTHTHRNTAP